MSSFTVLKLTIIIFLQIFINIETND